MSRRSEPSAASEPPTHPLELSDETMRAMVSRATDAILAHLRGLDAAPMHRTRGGRKLARSLREPLPEHGVAFEALLAQLFQRVIPASLNTASPGYLAYIPGGGLFHAAVADLIADATNRYVGLWMAAPALVQLEVNVLAWFAEILGMPAETGGVLTSGGSLANFTAIVAARRSRLPPAFQAGVLYVSDQVHHSITKAAHLAGFLPDHVRSIRCDNAHRIRIDELERAIERDRAEGLVPFLVVGSAGTTSTGAIDDLGALADVAAREKLWLHVDAAYGGFFALTTRGKQALAGIERADSVTLDPHKSLFLPYGTGCLLVRSREALKRAHETTSAYLPPMQTETDLVDFCELSPELSRDARGLRVWLPLKMHGASAFRDALDEKLDLARFAADELRRIPGVEIAAEPVLSLLAFRYCPRGVEDERLDALNRRLASLVNQRQRVLLTGATVEGRFLVRICILSFRTHKDRVDAAIADIRSAVATLEAQLGS